MAGEVERVKLSQRGHLYFELIEKGDRDGIVGKLDAVIWSRDHARIRRRLAAAGLEIAPGQQIRCSGEVAFWGPGGRLQVVVRDVDPLFTAGLLAERRRATLEALTRENLLERNKSLLLPPLPLDVVLVTSEGSAAYHDFLSSLAESGYGFRVVHLHASVQGREAERELVSALATVGGLRADCAVLIRGGGSRSDLAVFDGRALAEAVATCPLPVLTGLGHEIDQSICDLVAHTALRTPTRVAEFLVSRAASAERRLDELGQGLARASWGPLRQASLALVRAERRLVTSRVQLRHQRHRLEVLGRRLARTSRSRLARRAGREREIGHAIASAAQGRLRAARAALAGWSRWVASVGPERTLARGFSVTRDAAGRLVRDPGRLAAGDRLMTEVAAGRIVSRVEAG